MGMSLAEPASRIDAPARRILVVDDEEPVREIIAEALEYHGYDVVQAENGAQALSAIVDDPEIIVLITDIRMSGMTGIELAARALRLNPGLSIILISGYFLPQQTAWRFLRKPFHVEDLVAAVVAEIG